MSEDTSKTIYLVTDGCCSSYRIRSAFDDPALAEQFRLHFGYDQVEEYDLNPYAPQLRAGMRAFGVEMSWGGTVQRVRWADRPPTDDTLHYLYHGSAMETEMWAKDEQHAVQIANKRRIRALANEEWPKPKESA